MRNIRIFGVAAKFWTGDLQIERRDTTASANPESPCEIVDSDTDPNYSLSDDSYSNTSDSKSSSLHEVKVSKLNEL
jgi:hypothetical protein